MRLLAKVPFFGTAVTDLIRFGHAELLEDVRNQEYKMPTMTLSGRRIYYFIIAIGQKVDFCKYIFFLMYILYI